jgi:hypothetical protein
MLRLLENKTMNLLLSRHNKLIQFNYFKLSYEEHVSITVDHHQALYLCVF